jgi:hypothetical protein
MVVLHALNGLVVLRDGSLKMVTVFLEFSALLASRHKKRHSAHGHWQEKLALHRRRRGGRTQRDYLHGDRKLPSA